MKTNEKRKIFNSKNFAVAFLCLFGMAIYTFSDGNSTASESKGEPLLSAFSLGDAKPLLPNNMNTEKTVHFEGKAPLKITFNSSQFVGPMESYTWNFGDGEMAQGSVTSHTFFSAGKYSVTLTAKQKSGQIHQEQISVSVKSTQ